MKNMNVGVSARAERIIVWGASVMLLLVASISLYGSFTNSGAVASETGESSAVEAKPATSSIESILSDSDALCLVSMNMTQKTSITITDRSSIKANGCLVHSNSGSHKSTSIIVEQDAELDASIIYSNGTFNDKSIKGSTGQFVKSAKTTDPLSHVVAPSFEECDYRNIPIKVGKTTLKPGVYCGGIIALGDPEITLEPGIYIMKNGPLVLGGQASLKGENIGIYFTGSNSVLNLGVSSKIALTAPIDGPMAGVLFFEDRNAPFNNEFIIRSGNAQLLEGAIYLSKGKFVADAAAQIGQKAKWTALIANKIEMRNSAALVMNSDYSGSEIPVPEGVWPASTVASLSN